jgi:ADP-ribose pyrophosphatase
MDGTEQSLASKRVYEGRVFNVRVDTVRLQNGKEAVREVVEHRGACGVLALDENGRLLMVRQYRYPVGEALLEIPAGKIDPGEAPENCARRELCEETGYRCSELVFLGKIYPAAAYLNEIVYLYYAKNLAAAAQNLDEDEFLTVERVTLEDALGMVLRGEIPDSKTQIGILKLEYMIHRGSRETAGFF